MRKFLSLFLATLLILTAIVPAWAEPVTFVQTFGYTQARNREGNVPGSVIIPAWFHDTGRSYSQPLLFNGEPWGFAPEPGEPDSALVISIENGVLYGFRFPSGVLKLRLGNLEQLAPFWSQRLSATTKGEATLFNWNGRWLLFIGTDSNYLDIFDVTDFHNPFLVNRLAV
ncbi:MAG: hypothetical protein QHH75_06225 [Bacillota bacterium]|nr:hypothetical protein [Bacillota bacterium]